MQSEELPDFSFTMCHPLNSNQVRACPERLLKSARDDKQYVYFITKPYFCLLSRQVIFKQKATKAHKLSLPSLEDLPARASDDLVPHNPPWI